MHAFEKTPLWLTSLGSKSPKGHGEARKALRLSFLQIRQRVADLLAQIPRDVPGLTVHDISHIDALWETASLIAGNNYRLNPAEAFVLGVALLLHDAAMSLAAYPRGISELKTTPQWKDTIAALLHLKTGESPSIGDIENPGSEIETQAVAEVLRALHAHGAEKLPLIQWTTASSGPQYLIQDQELRNTYGPIIGKIAASHWWPISELVTKLQKRVNAGLDVPAEWFVEPHKLACLLRVADASQIDCRRAPGFLMTLLQPKGESEKHWSFQNKLGKPSADKQLLVYTGSPFTLNDAESWWLCYDMLMLVDEELRSANDLLDSMNMRPFALKGVKGAGYPETIAELIVTENWRPVNTELRVSDVPALVELLGGKKLYGDDPAAPLRELIQNASDAIKAKRALKNEDLSGTVRVSLAKEADDWWLTVQDDGIGMSVRVLTGALLDFGKSFWRSEAIRREFPGLLAKGVNPTGKYGIGFFSVFMLGDHVTVTSCRYDAASSESQTLEFQSGLRVRPILRDPTEIEMLNGTGTRIRVKLRGSSNLTGGADHKFEPEHVSRLICQICPALDVDVEVQEPSGTKSTPIRANDWQTIDEDRLLSRFDERWRIKHWRHTASLAPLTPLVDSEGRIYGRAAIGETYTGNGIVAVGGFRACWLNEIRGVFVGESQTVVRNAALPIASREILQSWARDQLLRLEELKRNNRHIPEEAAQALLVFGVGPGELSVAHSEEERFNASELEEYFQTLNRVRVYCHGDITYDSDDDDNVSPREFDEFVQSEDLIFASNHVPHILSIQDQNWPRCVVEPYPEGYAVTCLEVVTQALFRAWGVGFSEIEDADVVGEVNGTDIVRKVWIFER